MTALWAEGCGLPSGAMLIKSALRDLLSVSYDMISILLIGSLRSPPPFRLRRTSPYSGGIINRSMLFCRDMAPWLSIHSPTTKWGEGGGASHQRGIAFPRPPGRLYGFRCPRQRHIKLPSEPARSVGRTHRSVRSTRTIEPGRREAPEPSSPSGLVHKACQPSGILESTAQSPAPIPTAPQAPGPQAPIWSIYAASKPQGGFLPALLPALRCLP